MKSTFIHWSMGCLLAASCLAPARAQEESPAAEEPVLQDEKMFQRLVSDYHLLARILISQNRLPEAIQMLRRVYELTFKQPAAAIELCDLLDQAGQPGQTVPILEEQAKAEPLNSYWPKRLVSATEKAGRWQEALQQRLARRKSHPADLDNLGGLAEIYRRLNRAKEADELIDKLALTARDKLFLFEKPPSAYRDPHQDRVDEEGFVALRLQRQFGMDDDFEQYAAAYLLRQKDPSRFNEVLGWLTENPPTGYLKSVFPEQQVMGLWLANRKKEAAEVLEKKFPARQYPGADHLLYRYYLEVKRPEMVRVRFGEEVPDYLGGEKAAPPKPQPQEGQPEAAENAD